MDSKETSKGQYGQSILLHNEEYFKYIFKKTEKIVSAVFYTLRAIDDDSKKDTVLSYIEQKSFALLETIEKSLRAPLMSRTVRIDELSIALIALESALHVGVSARLIKEDLFLVFQHEFGLLHRAFRDFIIPFKHELGDLSVPAQSVSRKVPRVRERSERQQETIGGVSISRGEQIYAIIKDKGEVSIKDISSMLTNVSEKTIQRDLMTLIEKGQIVKDGERRWSRYKILTV